MDAEVVGDGVHVYEPKDEQRNRDRADVCEQHQDEPCDLVGHEALGATCQPPGPRVRRQGFGSSHPIRILRREQHANGQLSLRGAAGLLKVDPESEPAGRDSEQAVPRLGLSRTHRRLQALDRRSGRSPAARFGMRVALLESEAWCGTVDACLLIDEIDRRRAGRVR